MDKCKHSRTELICISRKHTTVQEIKEDLWHDYIVGVKCRDCKDEMPMPEIIITHFPYRGKPNYQVKNSEEEPVKSDPIPEFNC